MSGPHDGGSRAACSEGSNQSSGSPAASNRPAFRASEEGIRSYPSPLPGLWGGSQEPRAGEVLPQPSLPARLPGQDNRT